jgi:hypothetical protein
VRALVEGDWAMQNVRNFSETGRISGGGIWYGEKKGLQPTMTVDGRPILLIESGRGERI